MQLMVLCVGQLKERYWVDAVGEYTKRLSRYVNVDTVEVGDEATPDNPTDAERQQVLRAEATRLQKYLRDRDGIVVLDIHGKAYDSESWSRQYQTLASAGYGRLVFVIGGSLGLDESIRSRAICRWSFGPLTLPHQLARVVMFEQIYRGIRIARGEPYHK